MSAPRPFTIDVPQSQLDDLKTRLALTRFPEPAPVDDWSQGMPLGYTRELVDSWRDDYDWRRCEARLNALPNYLIEIDGLDIHPHPRPLDQSVGTAAAAHARVAWIGARVPRCD